MIGRLAIGGVLALALVGCGPSSRPGEPAPIDYKALSDAVDVMLPKIREHAVTIASFGSRQTGQVGCERTFDYVRSAFQELDGGAGTVRCFSSEVTVPLDRFGADHDAREHTTVTIHGPDGEPQTWQAFALMPNCIQPCRTRAGDEQPRRLIDLGDGRVERWQNADVRDAVVLLDFNSGQAWLRARELGAYAAVFIEPEFTTVDQADLKYLEILPLYMPRVWLAREHGLALRQGLASGEDVRVTVRTRLDWVKVRAPCVEMIVPGEDRSRTFVVAAHFDARSIVPDLSLGGDEIWGISALLEIARYFKQHRPACDLRFIAVSGHWQSQRCTRDYIAYPGPGFDEVGRRVKLAIGLDYSTENPNLSLMREHAWDSRPERSYLWLRRALFNRGGWRDSVLEGFGDRVGAAEVFAGTRPMLPVAEDDPMAPRDDRCPMAFAPGFPTANEAWSALNLPSFAFQTSWLYRLTHFTPLDTFQRTNADERFEHLGPQVKISLAMMRQLLHYPAQQWPHVVPKLRQERTYGLFSRLRGRVQVWDPSTGWFAERLPGQGQDDSYRTFVYSYPMSAKYRGLGQRLRNYLYVPLAPSRLRHRNLQCFMFKDMELLDEPSFMFNTLHCPLPTITQNTVAYSLDQDGRVVYATDYGMHGDGAPGFQCTDRPLDYWDLYVPVTLFECGSVELFSLIDPDRRRFNVDVVDQWYMYWGDPGNEQDRGVDPYVRVNEVRNIATHTELSSWGYTQWQGTALVFLPPSDKAVATESTAAEILLGTPLAKFTALTNVGADGVAHGYRVRSGETIRFGEEGEADSLAYVKQLYRLDRRRLSEFEAYDVGSPLAHKYHRRTQEILTRLENEQAQAGWQRRLADDMFAWNNEAEAYSRVRRLLYDVVSTTVFYFVLLIPFALLVERLLLPQPTVLRTCLVAAVVFAVFVLLLYIFHPGFHLAANIVVTVVAFVIVVLTIPALILLGTRGVAMLRAIGSKALLTQRSEAERAGVISAALSLSVSNMRRRRLRTGLTLTTITVLVAALVLLTTSSTFQFKLREPVEINSSSFFGVQIYNASDHNKGLKKEMVDMYEGLLQDEATVIRREYVNYGYDNYSKNGQIYVRANDRKVGVPYLQIMDEKETLLRYSYLALDGQRETVSIDDLITGRRIGPDDVEVILLPNTTAGALGVSVGDTVELMTLPLEVIGIWQAEQQITQPDGTTAAVAGPLDQLSDLDGLPITPIDSASARTAEPLRPLHAASKQMVILPRRLVQQYRMLPPVVMSMVVIPHDRDKIRALADRLSNEIRNVDVFSHYIDPTTGQDRVEMISMRLATQVSGSGMMWLMLAIAVLMIMAIMTGTVYERIREINIYSSVGLSPGHVASMFLVESLVYAGLASVLGYFVGIIILRTLSYYDLLPPNFYPNYLGVYVLIATLVAVAAMLLSSIYPITVAARTVNPSLERTWRVESEPAGDDWRVPLPFIATSERELDGIMTYAFDFLMIHQGERSGRFVCQTPPTPGRTDGWHSIDMEVWLAPFERNVTQYVSLQAVAMQADRWQFVLQLRRLSGPDYLWHKGTRVFVDALRKHLLNWRAMTPDQCDAFADRAGELFGGVPVHA